MKETGKLILSICSKLILLALIAFPVLAGIHYFTEGPFETFEQYKKAIGIAWSLFMNHWDWVTAAIITPILCRGAYRLYAPLVEEIRQNVFEKEMIRWLDTPYISPLHHLYMLRPPRWIRWENNNPFRNTFYKFVVQAFRDLIYRRYDYKNFKPEGKRPSVWQVVPRKTWTSMITFTVLPLLMIGYLFKQNGIQPFVGYYVLTLPVIIAFLARLAVLVIAIKDHASWKQTDKMLVELFGEIEPKIRWMELHPNQQAGRIILETWKAECRLRQDRDYRYRSTRKLDMSSPLHYPVTNYMNYAFDNPSLPSCPYPEEQIPEWAENYDSMYNGRMEEHKEKQREEIREVAKASGGKVVSFEVRRKK